MIWCFHYKLVYGSRFLVKQILKSIKKTWFIIFWIFIKVSKQQRETIDNSDQKEQKIILYPQSKFQ